MTADINIGSMAAPAYMPDLCDCDHEDDDPPLSTRDPWVRRLDAVARIKAGECAWCNGPTYVDGASDLWCSEHCQSLWQEKYAV